MESELKWQKIEKYWPGEEETKKSESLLLFHFSPPTIPRAFLYLAIACGLLTHSPPAQIVVLQVNKENKSTFIFRTAKCGAIKVGEVYRKEHEICATFRAIFIHRLLGFFSLLGSFFVLAVNTPHCNAVSLFSNFKFLRFFLARSNDFTFLSLFFIIPFPFFVIVVVFAIVSALLPAFFFWEKSLEAPRKRMKIILLISWQISIGNFAAVSMVAFVGDFFLLHSI